MQVIADGQVIQDHFQGGMSYIYVSAENGAPGLEYGSTGDYDGSKTESRIMRLSGFF